MVGPATPSTTKRIWAPELGVATRILKFSVPWSGTSFHCVHSPVAVAATFQPPLVSVVVWTSRLSLRYTPYVLPVVVSLTASAVSAWTVRLVGNGVVEYRRMMLRSWL